MHLIVSYFRTNSQFIRKVLVVHSPPIACFCIVLASNRIAHSQSLGGHLQSTRVWQDILSIVNITQFCEFPTNVENISICYYLNKCNTSVVQQSLNTQKSNCGHDCFEHAENDCRVWRFAPINEKILHLSFRLTGANIDFVHYCTSKP